MLATIAKVQRTAYLRLPQDELLIFSENVVKRTFEVERYKDLAETILSLKVSTENYRKALIAAADGGKALIFAKNQSKKTLINDLDAVGDLMGIFANGEESYIIDAGMVLQKKKTRSIKSNEAPAMPFDVTAWTNGEVGALELTFQLEDSKSVLNVAVEWRPVGTTAWNNGNYYSKTKNILRGLPSLTEVEVRFRAIGRDDMKSVGLLL